MLGIIPFKLIILLIWFMELSHFPKAEESMRSCFRAQAWHMALGINTQVSFGGQGYDMERSRSTGRLRVPSRPLVDTTGS